MKKELIRMTHVTCQKEGKVSIRDGNLAVYEGEFIGFFGLDDSGMNEMTEILGGKIRADGGEIYLNGGLVSLASEADAQAAGIYTIYNDTCLNGNLSIAENIFVTNHKKKIPSLVNYKTINRMAKHFLEDVQLEIDPRKRAASLSSFEQLLVALAKATYENCNLILLDNVFETFALTEMETFVSVMDKMKSNGISFVAKLGKINKVISRIDRAVIMRSGITVKTLLKKHIERDAREKITSYMLGHNSVALSQKQVKSTVSNKEVLRVEGLKVPEHQERVSFTVYEGETLGLLDAEGKTGHNIARILYGLTPCGPDGGIFIEGKRTRIANPQDAVKNGLRFLPDHAVRDRMFQNLNIPESVALAGINKISDQSGIIKPRLEKYIITEFYKTLQYSYTNTDLTTQRIRNLDNCARYEILFGQWKIIRPKIIIMQNPTAYDDEITREYVCNRMKELNGDKISFLLILGNLSEVKHICDRVIRCENQLAAGN